MKKRKKTGDRAVNRHESATGKTAPAPPQFSRGKLWCFRVLAAVGVPMAFVGLVELILHLVGYGYNTGFVLSDSRNGEEVLVQNNQFGWRFFGPQLARQPYPFAISPKPAPDTIRVLVLGESAAKGDPDPHFGLSRMLEATLSLRHPDVRFEVVNAAMTAINSHAVLPIARDCVRLNSDIWVVYMGNNEVVGPFGAGTVFGPQTPPLRLIRGALALKTTRTGQMFDALLSRVRQSPTQRSEWGGMEMFLDQQVRADDPRMNGVYQHFERNLVDILQAARRSGADVVLSTVAVNLRDCAPFASAHRPDLSEADKLNWSAQYQLGIKAQAAGRHSEAAGYFQAASRFDETFAELRFRQGQCALALGQVSESRRQFQAARDLDTLRFRCDTRLNEATRKVAANRELERVVLADAERVFADQSREGLPGEELFYEHVHLTLQGNHLLARTVGEQVEKLLATRLTRPADAAREWPSLADCARRLGWSDWSHLEGLRGILPRLNNPPFTGQFNHQTQMARVRSALASLTKATQPDGISNALDACQTALALSPSDPPLHTRLAALKRAAGDLAGSETAMRRALELLPSDAEGWGQLGMILARQQKFSAAAAAFRRAVEMNSQDVASLESLAQTLAALGQHGEALREFQRVLTMKPRLGLAWLHHGQLLEKLGRKQAAAECFQKALLNPGQNLAGLVELAGFCQGRGWFEAAATNYVAAINSDPSNAQLFVGAGQNFAALGRNAEAARFAAEAVRLSPDFAEARLLHGMLLGRQGQLPQATEQFREALRLKPSLLDARINLGVALAEQNPAEALTHFEEALRQSPANPAALKHAQRLRVRLGGQSPP